jgi:hypothetical protein
MLIPISLYVGNIMLKEIALQAVDDALLLNGYKEKSENWDVNIKKYLACVFIDFPAPYCIAFVKYRFLDAAEKLKLTLSKEFLSLDGWCPNWFNYAKKHDIWTTAAEARLNTSLIKKGYIVLFYSDIKGRHYHGGLVVSTTKEGVYTIEANTTDSSGLDPDGEGIYKKFRRWNSLGRNGGFIRTY